MGKASFTPASQNYRFYNDDGGEAASTPYAGQAQDTNITVNNASDAQFHLRWLVQETGGADGATTDDWGLQYQVNGTGGWTSITASSSRVRAYTSSQLTADGATTNRATNGITGGSGTFVAGEQEETNGVIEDRQLTTSNYTEHVWALELVSADNSNGETLHFRMTLNGGNPGMTNSSTPVVTISKPVTHTTTGALTGPGSTVAGTATHYTLHTSTGALTGPGSTVAGVAAHEHAATGAITGPGSTVAGTANHSTGVTSHDTDGILVGPGSTLSGVAAHEHATTGALVGAGPTLSGVAAHEHATTGAIVGAGSTLSGTAGHTTTHDATGALVGAGSVIVGVAVGPPSATTTTKSGGAGRGRRSRRVIILPSETGPEKVVVKEVPEKKPLQIAIERMFVDASTPEVVKPTMAHVDALIARMDAYKPPVMPKVKKEYYDIEAEDEEWLMLH